LLLAAGAPRLSQIEECPLGLINTGQPGKTDVTRWAGYFPIVVSVTLHIVNNPDSQKFLQTAALFSIIIFFNYSVALYPCLIFLEVASKLITTKANRLSPARGTLSARTSHEPKNDTVEPLLPIAQT
jgi:hypothetical protein